MTIIEVLLVLVCTALCVMLLQLVQRVRHLENQFAARPPEQPTLSARDLQMLQNSLTQLVTEVEQYTESQLRKMREQVQTAQDLCQQIEQKLIHWSHRKTARNPNFRHLPSIHVWFRFPPDNPQPAIKTVIGLLNFITEVGTRSRSHGNCVSPGEKFS